VEADAAEPAGVAADSEADSQPEPAADAESGTEAEPAIEVVTVADLNSDADAEPEPVVAVVAAPSVLDFRERMAALQQQFANAPTEAVAQAELVVSDAIAALHGILVKHAVDLSGWRQSEHPDAEELHSTMRRYQEYLDKLLSMS